MNPNLEASLGRMMEKHRGVLERLKDNDTDPLDPETRMLYDKIISEVSILIFDILFDYNKNKPSQ